YTKRFDSRALNWKRDGELGSTEPAAAPSHALPPSPAPSAHQVDPANKDPSRTIPGQLQILSAIAMLAVSRNLGTNAQAPKLPHCSSTGKVARLSRPPPMT